MPKGGKRAGAGKPKGYVHASTISALEQKQLAREVIREHVRGHIPDIIAAQVDNAIGHYVMTIRNSDGSFTVAETPEQVKAGLAGGGLLARIYQRQPHQGSASMLLAYAADKPVEPVEHSGPNGGPMEVTAVLQAARQRLKTLKKG